MCERKQHTDTFSGSTVLPISIVIHRCIIAWFVAMQVGSFNFDPAYKDDKATTKLVNTTIIPDSKIMRYCSKDDIFCSLTETTKVRNHEHLSFCVLL